MALAGALVLEVPPLLPVLQEHLDAYEELIPHLFISEATDWLIERYRADGSDPDVARFLAFLEARLKAARTYEQRDLIVVGFIESLPFPDSRGGDIRRLFGRRLRAELQDGESPVRWLW